MLCKLSVLGLASLVYIPTFPPPKCPFTPPKCPFTPPKCPFTPRITPTIGVDAVLKIIGIRFCIGIDLSVVWSIVLHSLLKQLLSKHKEEASQVSKSIWRLMLVLCELLHGHHVMS